MARSRASRPPRSVRQDRGQCGAAPGRSPFCRERRDRLPPADERRMIRVQFEPFDPAAELAAVAARATGAGAIASFTGLVRAEDGDVASLELDHYPALTVKAV